MGDGGWQIRVGDGEIRVEDRGWEIGVRNWDGR